MPIQKPTSSEKRSEFIENLMKDPVMVAQFPDEVEREDTANLLCDTLLLMDQIKFSE